MGLGEIVALAGVALAFGWFCPGKKLALFLTAAGTLVIYWLQPSTPLRQMDFWLPTAALGLTMLTWTITSRPDAELVRRSIPGLLSAAGVALGISLTRWVEPLCCLTASRPPALAAVGAALLAVSAASALPRLLPLRRQIFSSVLLILLLVIFASLKTPRVTTLTSAAIRTLSGQSVEMAGPTDLAWLGYSFLAFRLIHVLRDEQMGKLNPLTFQDLAAYALFFPTWVAGPIDRIQRWNGDAAHLATENNRATRTDNLAAGGQRLLLGVFKKFVLADSLAVIALNSTNATQTSSPMWMWVLLMGYTFRIYLDFSGYTDVAIGLGRLIGFHLPENFDRPYLKTNLTAFWNSWHITLAQWFRAYVFNPLTRRLRLGPPRLPTWMTIWIGQVSVMGLIGLWHGMTWNFLIWGLWHGMGLFVHNRWSDWLRPRSARLDESPRLHAALRVGGWALTFLFVSLGWVWFALPDPAAAIHVFATLVGR